MLSIIFRINSERPRMSKPSHLIVFYVRILGHKTPTNRDSRVKLTTVAELEGEWGSHFSQANLTIVWDAIHQFY